jgi:DNA-binding PadR family transcriptional regulator
VLGLLAFGERSGYDLIKFAERSVGFIWMPAKRNVYNVLPRLVAEGYASKRELKRAGRPARHLYRITRAGRSALRAWLREVDPGADGEAVLLLKIFFGGFAPPSAVIRQLEAYRELVAAKARTYKDIERRIAGDPVNEYPHLTLEYGIRRAETAVRWTDAALRRLGAQGASQGSP